MDMPKNIAEIQKENMDAAMKSFGAMSKGFQAIAVELANSKDAHGFLCSRRFHSSSARPRCV
jgi:hypothetical protein